MIPSMPGGDEVCFNERPLFTAGRPARGALARAKMISLGCAKKEKLTPEAPRATEEKGVKTDDSLKKVGKLEELKIWLFFLFGV